jgi:hypothetical protein
MTRGERQDPAARLEGRLEEALRRRLALLEQTVSDCVEPNCGECAKSREAIATARSALDGLRRLGSGAS